MPTRVNQPWNAISSQGAVWWVAQRASALSNLAPGGQLTLTLGDAYFVTEYSNITSLPVGTPVYAQVDSDNPDTNYGRVREIHEITGVDYNNILGSVFSASGVESQSTLPVSPRSLPVGPRVLPKR